MDSQSVHQLLTKLCQHISSNVSSSLESSNPCIPRQLPQSRNCQRTTVKKLLALSYEILLHKSNTICSYGRSWNTSKDDAFEYIRDPVCELLNLATPSYSEAPTKRMDGLQDCIDNLRKLGTLRDPTTQSAIAFLMELCDQAPEAQRCDNKLGFFGTGQFHVPTYSMDGTVTPYPTFNRETFQPLLLQRSLAGRISNSKLGYQIPDISRFYERPDFQISQVISRSCSKSSITSTKSQFSSITSAQLTNKPTSSSISNNPTTVGCIDNILSDEEYDIWELAAKMPDNNLRTWETVKDLNPKKCNPHLMEVSDTSLVHSLLHMRNVQHHTGSIVKLELCVVEYSEFISRLKYMLMGIGSTIFIFDEECKTFIMANETSVPGISPEALVSCLADLIACGSYCRRLNKLTNTRLVSNGPIFRQLCSSIQRYLYFYKAVVIKINDKTSILSITMKFKNLITQMQALGHLCMLDCKTELPTGIELLAYLYDEIMSFNNRDLTGIFMSVLHSCVTVYLRFLESWLFAGRCDNNHSEFFIEPNQSLSAERSRLFWKKAFKLHKAAVPGFMKGLENAVFESGKALNLLKLCNPSNPLLRLMEDTNPRLRFPLQSVDLTRSRTECESYYQQCIAVTGKPVTVDQLVEQSHEQQNALLERVKQVYAERHAQYKAKCKMQVKKQAAAKHKQMMDWQEECRRRTERKELEKQQSREVEEEWLREKEERDRELTYLEAERCLIEQHKENMSLLDQKVEYYKRQLAAPINDLSLATNASQDQIQISKDSSATLENAQQIHNNNELPTPNGNSQVDNTRFLDNCPIGKKTTENNWINIDADVQNRNMEPETRSPVCDNKAEVIPTTTDSTTTLACSEQLKLRTESLTLDLTRSSFAANRRKVLGTDTCLSHPWQSPGMQSHNVKPLRHARLTLTSQEEYSQMARACSRKGSAERIKRRMWGFDPPSFPSPRTDNKSPTVSASPGKVTKTVESLTAKDIKMKVLSNEYEILQTAEGDAAPEGFRNRCKVLGTSEEVGSRDLGTKYDIPQAAFNTANQDFQKNRTKVMHSEFDLVTGDRKFPWIIRQTQSEATKHNLTEVHVVDTECASSKAEMATIDASPLLITPQEDTAGSNKVDYLRNESILSDASSTLFPLCNSSEFNTGSAISTDCSSTVNPFFKTVPVNHMYSYAPFAVYEKEWRQQLKRIPSNIFQKILTPEETAINLCDLDTLDMASMNNMLKKSIILPVYTQMKLSNDAIIKFFLVDQDLLSHLQSLRNYFFLLDGEFGRTLTTVLFQELNQVKTPKELLNPNTLSSILSCALGSSMDKDHKNVPLLSFVVNEPPPHFRYTDPQILSCLNFSYKVEWPLNIIITDDVIKKYQQVFEFLLKLRRISWVLEEDFIKLKQLGKNRQYAASGQYNHVQLIRHIMGHLIQALHNYVTSTVLQESWSELQHDLQQTNTLDNIYHAHVLYIKTVLVRCLLVEHGRADNFHKYINNIFVLVLKFHEKLNLTAWTLDATTKQYRHPHYNTLKNIFKICQEQAGSLIHMSRKLAARGFYSHLFDLLQKLNMNNYYEALSRH